MVKTLKSFLPKNFTNIRTIALFVFCFSSFSFVNAANITLSPSSADYVSGKTYTVDVKVTNNQDNINGVSGVVSFPKDLLQVISVSKTGSIINTWAEDPVFSNSDGTISFEGVILNPGFSGSSGKAVSITFKAIESGTAKVFLKSGSVLANDGNATNVLGTLGSASFNISAPLPKEIVPTKEPVQAVPTQSQNGVAPTIISSTYPDQNSWYSSTRASFAWDVPSNVIAVSTLYDEKESSTPSKVYNPPINNKSFTVDNDGVMYMHVQFKTAEGWGKVANYKFQIDTQSPQKVEVSFPDGTVTHNPSPKILVTAEDSLSGLDHVNMSVDSKEVVSVPVNASNLYNLPKESSGKHTAVITVFDKAGNKNDVTVEYTVQIIEPPKITSYTKHLELGSTLLVSGETYPSTDVEISLASDDAILSQKTTSDEKGKFNLKWSGDLAKGVYELRARVVDSQGVKSDYSDTRVVTVENIPLVRVGIFIMNWMSLLLIIILAIFLLVSVLWYSYNQFGRFRRRIHRTMLEAENTLKVNVQALRRDIEEFYTTLLKAEKKRELTKEEQIIVKKFKKRLDIVEKEIEKKLESIG